MPAQPRQPPHTLACETRVPSIFLFFYFYFSPPILLGQFNLVMDLSFFLLLLLIPNFFY